MPRDAANPEERTAWRGFTHDVSPGVSSAVAKDLHSGRRILHLCAVDFTVRHFIAPIVLDQRARGADSAAACAPGPWWSEIERMGVPLLPLRIPRRPAPWSLAVAVLRLAALLRKERIEILHVHTPVAALVGRLAGRLAHVPVVLHTAHGYYFHDRMTSLPRRLHLAVERLASFGQDGLLCVSREDLRTARRERLLRPRTPATWIGNGADIARFDPVHHRNARAEIRRQLGIPGDAFALIAMGRLTREKGFAELFDAMRALPPEVHLIVAGGRLDSERDNIEQALADAAQNPPLAGRVHLLGFRDDTPALLAASDLFVLPSWREGLPVSLLEAMAMGLPAVVSDIRGCREALVDGVTGFLVPPRDADALAGAIDYLARHPEAGRRLGAAGRKRALAYFTLDQALERQRAFYRRVLRAREVSE